MTRGEGEASPPGEPHRAGGPEGRDAAGEASAEPPTEVASANRTPAGEERRRRKRPHERFRVPAWVVLILGPLAGWVVANWMGGLLGLAIGLVAWQSKR